MGRRVGRKIVKFLPAVVATVFVAAALFGIGLAILASLAGYPKEATDAAAIPIGICPVLGLMIWIWRKGPLSFTKNQNLTAGLWVAASAILAGYITTAVSTELINSAVASIPIGPLLFIVFLHLTDRLYRAGKQKNISKASSRPIDDPEVKELARNHELATSVTLAVLTTINLTTGLLNMELVQLSPEAARVLGITFGGSVGLLWFNFNPKQRDIREFISEHANPNKARKSDGTTTSRAARRDREAEQ